MDILPRWSEKKSQGRALNAGRHFKMTGINNKSSEAKTLVWKLW